MYVALSEALAPVLRDLGSSGSLVPDVRDRQWSDVRGQVTAAVQEDRALESKEYLAGFRIMEAADLDVALRLAAEGSKHCNRKIEVRPFAAE